MPSHIQAGGPLSEPTIESTTSYSPANSEVGAQKTVNNVTLTNIRSKDTHLSFCDVCNVRCDTEDVLKKHKQGKRHKKNVQKLAVPSAISQEMIRPAKHATLHQEAEEKKQDLLQSEASVDSLFVCGIPDVMGCIDQNILTVHIEGGNQVTNGPLCRDGHPNPTLVSLATVQPSIDKLDAHQIGWCEICKVNCTSDKTLQKHILGKKHKKNLKNSEKIVAPSLTPVASMSKGEKTKGETVHSEEPCNASCSSNVLSSYESGKKRTENLERSEKTPDLALTLPIGSLATPQKVEIPKSEENKSARCELCGICCNSCGELNKHILGKKHKKNMKKSEEIFGVGSEGSMEDERCKRKANWESDDDDDDEEEDRDRKKHKMMEKEKASISCKVCNVVCNSPTAFISHLASHDHSAMVLKQVKVEAVSYEVQL
ncbi:Zinc finger, C2H2-like protein [Cynara cardunculus var. scolymus]|uniref:Zinc finger, C2H2-like protein n=1 Tax=Cynara cardunculus var. scolymus TaxID=59895 RepID=A0A124SGH5_CYNCS|nr:Zinc finger, C2H2-like protein [Cynara cardunculus var. scolymus]